MPLPGSLPALSQGWENKAQRRFEVSKASGEKRTQEKGPRCYSPGSGSSPYFHQPTSSLGVRKVRAGV